MKRFIHKQNVIFFVVLITILLMLVGCFPAVANETDQKDNSSSPALTKTEQPTKTLVPTVSSTVTESPLPTQTLTLTESPTIQPSPQPTDTNIPIVLPTKTKSKQSVASTATPTSSSTPTSTATFCPPPTPEPLWVSPVTSPTDQLTQVIEVYIGYGKEVTVTTESGTFTVTGDFNAYTNPALVQISLLPGTTHHLEVTAKVKSAGNGCTYSYTLSTTRDRKGNPLEIVQGISSYP